MTQRERIREEDDLPVEMGDQAPRAERAPAQGALAPHQAGDLAARSGNAVRPLFTRPRDRAAEQLGALAQGLRETSHQLRRQEQAPIAHYAEQAADRFDQLSGYLHAAELGRLRDDAERLGRRAPLLFLGGAFVVGLLGARFLRSSRASSGQLSSASYRARSGGASAPQPSQISDETAARLLREAEQAYQTMVSYRKGQAGRRARRADRSTR